MVAERNVREIAASDPGKEPVTGTAVAGIPAIPVAPVPIPGIAVVVLTSEVKCVVENGGSTRFPDPRTVALRRR